MFLSISQVKYNSKIKSEMSSFFIYVMLYTSFFILPLDNLINALGAQPVSKMSKSSGHEHLFFLFFSDSTSRAFFYPLLCLQSSSLYC